MSKDNFITTAEKNKLVEDFLRKEFISNLRINTDLASTFLKGDLIYGKGIRNINRGFISPTDFTDENPKRVPNASVPSIYTEDLTDQIKLVFTNTISEEDYLGSMANESEMANFIQQLSNRLQQSYKLNLEQSIGYLFDDNVEDSLLTLTASQKTQLNKIKTKLTNSKVDITLDELSAEEIEKQIRAKSYELTRMKKTNSGVKNIPAACPVNEQILVISNALHEKILRTRKTQFNPTDLFKEYFKVIIIDATESNENNVFIIDKEAIRFYPRIHKVLSQDYNSRMETDYYLHFWLTIGIYESFVVKKIVFAKKAN